MLEKNRTRRMLEDNCSNSCMFYALLLAPKIKLSLKFIEDEVTGENKTFKGFQDNTKGMNRKDSFDMQKGITAKNDLPSSRKKSFSSGTIVPIKIGNC